MKLSNPPETILDQSRKIYQFFLNNKVSPPCNECQLHDPKFGLIESFKQYCDQRQLEVNAGNLSPSTLQKDLRTLAYLKQFTRETYNKSEVSLIMVDRMFLMNFSHWTTTSAKVSPATTQLHMIHLRTFLRALYDQGFLRIRPFASLRIKTPKSSITYLNEIEISEIRDFESTEQQLIDARDIFLFMYNTGLAYRDCFNLEKRNIHPHLNYTVISGRRVKTGGEFLIPLSFEAKYILEKYRRDERIEGSNRLFPELDYPNLNRNLKKIAKDVGIIKPLSTHVARHSYATSAIMYGVPITTIKKVMGHKRLETTMRYAEIVDMKVCTDMDRFNAGVIGQMSKNYSDHDKLASSMKIELSLDDQSWLAKQMASNSKQSGSRSNSITNDTYLKFERTVELNLIMSMNKAEYMLFTYLRMCPQGSSSYFIDRSGKINFSIKRIHQDLGGRYELLMPAIKKLSKNDFIKIELRGSNNAGHIGEINEIKNWNIRLTEDWRKLLNENELEFLEQKFISAAPASTELAAFKKCLTNQFRLLMLLRVLEFQNEVKCSTTSLVRLLNLEKTNIRNTLRKLSILGFIQYEKDGSGRFRIRLSLENPNLSKPINYKRMK